MIKPSYLPILSWFCSYSHLGCKLIGTRDERHNRIQNLRCLSQVLIKLIGILELSRNFLPWAFFHLVYDVINNFLQSMVLFTIMETSPVVWQLRNNVVLCGTFWNRKFSTNSRGCRLEKLINRRDIIISGRFAHVNFDCLFVLI